MSTMIFIYSALPLKEARSGLEDDLEDEFEAFIAVAGGGAGTTGGNIDLELAGDRNLDPVLPQILRFLRDWGVPADTYLEIVPDEGERRRVDVFGPAAPAQRKDPAGADAEPGSGTDLR